MNATQARWAQAVTLRDEQNMSFEAIGKTMGIAEDSARSYVSLGRRPDGFERERQRKRRSAGHVPMAEWQSTLATGGWTPAKVATLKKLWPTKLSALRIGKRIGTTKDAVIGKAHRLGLKPKPKGKRRRKS